MIITIKNHTGGKVASSRRKALTIIDKERINFEKNIIFDFSGIEAVSHSFIDELIGVYVEQIGKIPNNLKFKNSNDYIKEQIKFVITERIKK